MFMHTTMQRRAHDGAYHEGKPEGWDIMGVGLIAVAFALATAFIFLV